MSYVVCQKPKCQQTYPTKEIWEICKEIGYDEHELLCPKCNGVLVDRKGNANFSQNSYVIPVIDMNKYQENRKQELREKNKLLKELKRQIKELESEGY